MHIIKTVRIVSVSVELFLFRFPLITKLKVMNDDEFGAKFENDDPGTSRKISVQLSMWEFGQNNSKM